MKRTIMALKNIWTKSPNTVRVSREIWDALINTLEHIDGMDMRLVDDNPIWYYETDVDSGDRFITSLAHLEEVVWRNASDE